MSEKIELLPDERLAHDLAEVWLREYTDEFDHRLLGIVASAIHDGMEIKESMIIKAAEDTTPCSEGPLQHYALGFIHGLTDRDAYLPKENA